MKILHVINYLSPRAGGTVTVLQALAAYQAKAGLDVTIYSSNWGLSMGGASFDHINRRFLKDVVNKQYFEYWSPMMVSNSMARALKTHMSSFDLVHIHGLYRFPVTYAAWLARKMGIPYIIRPHGALDPFLYRKSRFGKMALPFKRIYEQLFDIPNLNHASAIHYTAHEEMERTTFLNLRAPAVIIPNGIDWQQYDLLPQGGGFRGRIGLEAQIPLVLFLGRINFKKGLDLLVPSFTHVLEKVPDARLAIVGPDNDGYSLKVKEWCREQGIADKVFFVDHLGPEDVIQAYLDADVFVLPSYTENFGMTVVEAMASGCPVVISDQVNIWHEVMQEKAGLVVGLSPSEIANAVCWVLANKEAAGAMGKRGRIAAKKLYAWPQIVDQMMDIYRKLISENKASKATVTP